METQRNWFGHIEWAVLLLTLLGGFYTLDAKIERQCAILDSKIDRQCEMLSQRIEIQSARSDQLYEMFIDLLKERK